MSFGAEEDESRGAYYWAPILHCKNQRASCPPIQLPAFLLPDPDSDQEEASEEVDRDQLGWPSGEWKAFFACSSCGLLSEYSARDVRIDFVQKQNRGKYYSGANCFRIEVECADMHCKSPAHFHVEKSGADESEISTLLRDAFFLGTLACGHAIPSRATSIRPVRQI
jgi:hypothetical protein